MKMIFWCIFLLQVNTNGVLSFRSPFFDFVPRPFPLSTNEILIAPFWDDFNVLQGGQILFRQSNDGDLLTQVGTAISDAFMWEFSPTLLFIATWDGVPGFATPSNVRYTETMSNRREIKTMPQPIGNLMVNYS